MVVLYGSRNFGYESKESEKTWLEFKYPTWDNIINNEFIGYDRLGADNNFIDEVCYLISMHDTAITKEEINSNYTLAYKRYKIQICDALAHHPLKLEKRIKYLEKIKKLLTDI